MQVQGDCSSGRPGADRACDASPDRAVTPFAELDHEARLEDLGQRKALGAYYTPPDVVDGLLRLSLDPLLAWGLVALLGRRRTKGLRIS